MEAVFEKMFFVFAGLQTMQDFCKINRNIHKMNKTVRNFFFRVFNLC